MIGRLLRGGFMTAIYAYLYIPIIILIVNSFNSSRFGINWQGFTTKWYELWSITTVCCRPLNIH